MKWEWKKWWHSGWRVLVGAEDCQTFVQAADFWAKNHGAKNSYSDGELVEIEIRRNDQQGPVIRRVSLVASVSLAVKDPKETEE